MKTKKQKVKFPISVKLILIFSLLVVAVLSLTIYMVFTLVRNDEQIKAEENNHTINARTAASVQDSIESTYKNAVLFFNSADIFTIGKTEKEADVYMQWLFEDYCRQNSDTIFLFSSVTKVRSNAEFAKLHPNADQRILSFLNITAPKSVSDKIEIKNVSDLFETPALCLFFPYSRNGKKEMAAVAFLSSKMSELMSSGSFNTSFMINGAGDVLIHSDYQKMLTTENMASLEAVKSMTTSDVTNSQNVFPNENNVPCFYAYHRLSFIDAYMVTSQEVSVVFESIDRTIYQIGLFSLAILFLAIILIRFFSKTISLPLRRLVDASRSIESGDFMIDIKAKTHDEVGLLTTSFTQMGKGLAERERLKTTFGKFTNKIVAERAMKGELALGGENKMATIFFSDIRGFTAISEKLLPEEVVEFLNDYMTRMVKCVNKTGGVVDKYIGDAIMAVWGVPESAGSPADDAWNCVHAALMMRKALFEFNKGRGGPKKPILKIGCGINSGPVVAGQIGSSDRMEYTVIGDAVNFASRTESLNKPLGTDILITENTYELIRDRIIAEEMPSVQVKGKEKPVRMFAVINAISAKYPRTLDDVRTLLHIDPPKLDKVDVNAEEKKYKIGS